MAAAFKPAILNGSFIPAANISGDLLFAQAKRDQDEYDRLMEEEAAAAGEDSAARAFAIRQAMEAYGFSEDEIVDAIAAAGYKKGGRVGFNIGGGTGGLLDMLKERIIAEPFKGEEGYIEEGVDMEEFKESEPEEIESEETEEGIFKIKDKPIYLLPMNMKKGGRVGFSAGGADFGGITEAVETIEQKPKEFLVDKLKVTQKPGQSEMRAIIEAMYNDIDGVMPEDRKREFYELYAPQMYMSGEMEKPEFEFIQTEILDKEVPKMKEGGIMDLGGKEMDLRGGGFVPIGKKEKADDVPARLSKNEFVMTADAVRAAGGGSVNKGAKRMYNLMNSLEARV